MNHLPITPPSPEQQQRSLAQLHSLLASQAESYHRSRHMGPSTSVSTELARELMDSGMRATEACYRCGWRSYSSFTRAYGKHLGTTPTGRLDAGQAREADLE